MKKDVTRFPITSVLQKFIMALSGLFLVTFLIEHVAGNILLFLNDDGITYDAYSHFLTSNVVIRTLEFVLVFGFIIHILYGILLTVRSKTKRAVRYAVGAGSSNSTLSSRAMIYTGVWVLLFLVIHLKTFWVKLRLGTTHPSPYELVKTVFEGPIYVLFYVISFYILAVHLKHGFQSAFQSVGVNHSRYTPMVKVIGVLLCIIVPVLFAAIPVFFYVKSLVGA